MFHTLIDVLAFIGAITVVTAAYFVIRCWWDAQDFSRYQGLREQVAEDWKAIHVILEEENAPPIAFWALGELARVVRTRNSRGRDRLLESLENSRRSPGE